MVEGLEFSQFIFYQMKPATIRSLNEALCISQETKLNQKVSILQNKFKSQTMEIIISLQRQLNHQLKLNIQLVEQHRNFLLSLDQSKRGGVSSTRSEIFEAFCKEDNQKKQIKNVGKNFMKEKKKKRKAHIKKQADSQYMPSNEEESATFHYEMTQTKNLPRTFGKSIVAYIKKNPYQVRILLNQLGQDFDDFNDFVTFLKGQANTNSELSCFWKEKQNKYAKALRILSMKYIKEHSFTEIFNSKVSSHRLYLRYRHKILHGLQEPETFI